MTVPELVAQALQNLLPGPVLSVIQQRGGNLQVVPNPFLPHDTEIHLLLYPTVHDAVDSLLRGAQGKRCIFAKIRLLGPVEFPLHRPAVPKQSRCPHRLLQGCADSEHEMNLLCLPGPQHELMLQDAAQDEQRRS